MKWFWWVYYKLLRLDTKIQSTPEHVEANKRFDETFGPLVK